MTKSVFGHHLRAAVKRQIGRGIARHGVEISSRLACEIDSLSDRDLAVVQLKLDRFAQKDIAIAMGVTEGRVSQIVNVNLARLWSLIADEGRDRVDNRATFAQAIDAFGVIGADGRFRWDSGRIVNIRGYERQARADF